MGRSRRNKLKRLVVLFLIITVPMSVLFYTAAQNRVASTVAEPVRQGDERSKQVAFTVNVDWGEEYIPGMLEVCRVSEAKLTFFLTGRWADLHPDLARQIKDEGHEIGNHGYGHPHPDQLSVEQNRADIVRAENAIFQATGHRPTLYAPPYGESGKAVLIAAENSGYTVVLWSLDTVDWKNRNRDAILDRVKTRMHNGAILLMHPTEATAQALPEMLSFIGIEGLEPVTVSELIGKRK
ncbi:MAG: polysaccharide deacetylase family protein [Eubacteriales bacterium]|nr:polysaccharide deacetylase family protein [Bacillota bacterium]MBV1727417.1 polysaccharide deacetylase family protein [Desulforudis sp.]MDZ4043692.1 polysaccharide deacetylase family protein [Eubacteriales bacterium]MBU4532891.1 polysaccharide deacetylase family protein [Bacillota bacterium]MBV1736435.1 polysaccharide deacetylase family protein [Desulforudis sp.]